MVTKADYNAEIEPVPTTGGGRRAEPELDRLSNILKKFNDQFGTLFTDADRVAKRILDDVVPMIRDNDDVVVDSQTIGDRSLANWRRRSAGLPGKNEENVPLVISDPFPLS